MSRCPKLSFYLSAMRSLYKRAVDLEAGGAGTGLLEDDSASASSISEELSMRRSSSASPGTQHEQLPAHS